MLSDTVVGILREAARRIANPGRWCKYQGRDGDRVCLVVAIDDAARYLGSSSYGTAVTLVWRAARERYPNQAYNQAPSIPSFNDDAATTHEHIMDVLAIAIRRAPALAHLDAQCRFMATHALPAPAEQLQNVNEAFVVGAAEVPRALEAVR